MPESTKLSGSPYDDDYSVIKDYYKILFQRGVSVQTRELNQLQTLFQQQIERFGDNIFQKGTIVSGCNFLYLTPYPYIKIKDQTTIGGVANPQSYQGYQAINQTTGLLSRVVNSQDGYESSDPNLKTLFLNYLNTGYDTNTAAYTAGDVVTIFDGQTNGVEKVLVETASAGFANTDQVIAVSSIVVSNSAAFTNGQYITNNLEANAQIIGIDSTTLKNTSEVILSLKPRPDDLANNNTSSLNWSFLPKQAYTTVGGAVTGVVNRIIGSGFSGSPVTDGIGAVINVNVFNKGFGYTAIPHVTIRSIGNEAGYSSLKLTAQNYLAQVTIALVANAVGNGYAFGVNEGVIYQKGYFLRVPSQTIIVDPYTVGPDNVAVGFTTLETIVNHNVDSSLNDPAAGQNAGGPGADRLQLTPQLVLVDPQEASTNSAILPIVIWSQGQHYVQRPDTIYSTIGNKIAEGINDQSGDFILDPLLVSTRTTLDDAQAMFNLIVDPGTVYIDGFKVVTNRNYTIAWPKSFSTMVRNNFFVSLNYGNFIQVNNLGGTFQFNTGDTVQLYATAKNFLANTELVQSQSYAPAGTSIGTARIRSLSIKDGTPGTPQAIYNLYLFDVHMANGKNFSSTKSIYYNGTKKGVCDVATTPAQVSFANNDSLVFTTPYQLKNSNNNIYAYRTIDQTLTINNTNGLIVKNITANSSEKFTSSGILDNTQMRDLYVVSTSVDLVYSANLSGTSSVTTGSANLTGSSTNYLSELRVGDWVYIYTTASYDLKQVRAVANSTSVILDANVAFVNATAHVARCFPVNVPIPFGHRDGLSANVNVSSDILTLDLGGAITAGSPQTVAVGCSIARLDVTQSTKTPNRKKFVKIRLSDNVEGTKGPWCLGVTDIFRLRGVWIGDINVSNTSSNYFDSFYIDNGQTPNFYGLGYLYVKPNAAVTLASANYLLAEFDYYTSSPGNFYCPTSYVSANTQEMIDTDAKWLADLTNDSNTWEIPTFFTDFGKEYDLQNCYDFRPSLVATATPSATVGGAPINPSETETFDTNEKRFPVPSSPFAGLIEYFTPGFVSLYIDKNGQIAMKKGVTTNQGTTPAPTAPGTMKIADVYIPEYPSYPKQLSPRWVELINNGMASSKYVTNRIARQMIRISSTMNQTQSHAYNMHDIATIDRRLKNVEYYLSLNKAETALAATNIPSTLDPTMDRYKFGFFAINYSNPVYVEQTDPQYAADIINNEIVPPRLDWEIHFGAAFDGAFPYINEIAVSQLNATIGDATDPTAQPQCALAMANSIAYQMVFRTVWDSSHMLAPQDGAIDKVNLTLADQSHMVNASNTIPVDVTANLDKTTYSAANYSTNQYETS